MKSIKIGEFLDRLHKRLKAEGDSDALIFFEVFLQNKLIKELDKQKPESVPSNWQELNLVAGDYDDIYHFAVNILHNAASSSFSEHSDTYKAAHAVSVAFCQELNEVFGFTGDKAYDLIPIKSYVDMAVEAGMVKIENGMVHLTTAGEEIAQSVEREIKGGQN